MASTRSILYPPRVVSGIRPTASIHLGHFFGAISQHLRLQHEYPGQCFFAIADYHAINRGYERSVLRKAIRGLASAYLALGLATNKAVLYRQSDVPQLAELFWILCCHSSLRDLLRMPSFKASRELGLAQTAALTTYPVLMASDILGLRATIVPVGHDLLPCLERVRDIARAFNRAYNCEFFPSPLARVSNSPVVRGIDGRKMSSTYGNAICLFEDFYSLRQKVKEIRTDSRGRGEPKDPNHCTVFQLFSLVAAPEEVKEMRSAYEHGEIGYSEAKRRLLLSIQEYFGNAQERFHEISKRPDFVEDVLREGFCQAADGIQATTEATRQLLGLSY